MQKLDFRRLEKELHVTLPARVLKVQKAGEYNEPVDPEHLLDPHSAVLWGGQMPPDCLPLLGNGAGDVLLARFAGDGSIREFLEWHHEGGFLDPADLMPGFPSPTAELRRRAERALSSGLAEYCREYGGGQLAEDLGIPWTVMSGWLADADTVDQPCRERITKKIGRKRDLFAQNWKAAEKLARAAGEQRPDLSWPGQVLGRAAERRGDTAAAVVGYTRSLKGLRTMAAFTDVWDVEGCPYSATRLRVVLGSGRPDDAHLRACLTGDYSVVRQFWLDAGKKRLRDGRATEAYECYFHAGWDWFVTNDMDMLLGHVIDAAKAAGSASLVALARLHLETLKAIGQA